jgi:hypothetical protein
MPRSRPAVLDHGIEGWYRAIEVPGALAETLRVGGRFRHVTGLVVVVRLSRRRPTHEDGVVVLVKPADARRHPSSIANLTLPACTASIIAK